MRAAVQPDQLLDQRQADAAALVGPRPGVLDAVEPLEQPRHLRGGHADPGVGDGDHRVGVLAPTPDRDGAVEGELQRVGEQVEHHLLPHVAVDVDGLVQRRAVHLEVRPARSTAERKTLASSAVTAAEVDRLVAGLHPAGLDAGEVEQGVDQLGQPQPVAVHHVQLVARPVVEPSARPRSSSTGPRISVSGVRNSWLMLEKNVVFARSSSASSSARRCWAW